LGHPNDEPLKTILNQDTYDEPQVFKVITGLTFFINGGYISQAAITFFTFGGVMYSILLTTSA
jgi:hypothetical protein